MEGAGDEASVSSAVPSMVQKVNHSSEKVWLQVGQRFMVIGPTNLSVALRGTDFRKP